MLRSVKYGLYGAVLAGLVGGTVAWTNVNGDKTVHLLVDGHSHTIHTSAARVGDVLDAAGYHVKSHDLLAPGARSAVKDDETIVFRRGRLLRLDVDGSDRYVWTTAPTVAAALGQLGYSDSDFVSVSRSRRLPLKATDIAVRTPKQVTVEHDGQTSHVTSTDATVGALLRTMGLTLGPDDRLSTASATPLADGDTIKLTRVVQHTVTKTKSIKFATKQKSDSAMKSGHTKVLTKGHNGLRATTWALVYVDGKLVGKAQMRSIVVRQPVDQVEKVGTKGAPAASDTPNTPKAPIPSPGSAQAIAKAMLKDFGWSSDQFDCLNQMWSRESGWRVNAANPSGAYGIPQALPGSKMSSAGPNWQTNAHTQIKWGLGYIASRYNSPCQAWALWQQQGWY